MTISIYYLHNFSIRMIAFNLCIMAFIKYQKRDLLNLDKAVRQIMQKYLRCHNKDLYMESKG